ncbi:MAG: hypothetical protein DRQ55_05665 [Planctomycetota bacterium]|nr:MAG: hypothetical protein DRQ55_05665 [Planctomycetota bacterium]
MEVLMAAVVISMGFVGATWAMSATARTQAMYSERSYVALALAKELYELAETLPKQPGGAPGATSAAGVLALDSLAGGSFSPPLKANGSTHAEMSSWRQQCSLAVYDLSDLSTPTEDSPLDALPADGSKLYRLEVIVSEGGQPIETAHWWITP